MILYTHVEHSPTKNNGVERPSSLLSWSFTSTETEWIIRDGVERPLDIDPWGILILFTICLPLQVKSPCHRLTHVAYARNNTLSKTEP